MREEFCTIQPPVREVVEGGRELEKPREVFLAKQALIAMGVSSVWIHKYQRCAVMEWNLRHTCIIETIEGMKVIGQGLTNQNIPFHHLRYI